MDRGRPVLAVVPWTAPDASPKSAARCPGIGLIGSNLYLDDFSLGFLIVGLDLRPSSTLYQNEWIKLILLLGIVLH